MYLKCTLHMRNGRPERRRCEGRRKKSRRLTILPFCVIQSFQIVLVVKSFYWTKSYISSAVLHLHLRCSCFYNKFWCLIIYSKLQHKVGRHCLSSSLALYVTSPHAISPAAGLKRKDLTSSRSEKKG